MQKIDSVPTLGVSDFVAVFNQTLEYAYPSVSIVGELSDFRVSKNRWVYFNLKDETASLKFFGTVYNLPGPLEDGMMLEVRGQPRLHPLFGFSVNIQSIKPVGEGSIRKAASLLEAKLIKEGLFDENRKRPLPYSPQRIGLITAADSAAYHDFVKILGERWGGLEVLHIDTQVQGEAAMQQIVDAIAYFNTSADIDVLVVTRGGGSLDDLAVFNTEPIVRAIAGSRVPTLVAIGHEVDISLAELAADKRASTPTNAAQVLVPDKKEELARIENTQYLLSHHLTYHLATQKQRLQDVAKQLRQSVQDTFADMQTRLQQQANLLEVLSPESVLKRGYAIVSHGRNYIKETKQVKVDDELEVRFSDGRLTAKVTKVQ